MKIAWSYSVYYLTLHKFQKKKYRNPYKHKVMMLLESEIDLLKFTFLRTNHFSNNNQSNIPKVYFIPNSRKGLGIDSMGELAVSFNSPGNLLMKQESPFHISILPMLCNKPSISRLGTFINLRVEYSSANLSILPKRWIT